MWQLVWRGGGVVGLHGPVTCSCSCEAHQVGEGLPTCLYLRGELVGEDFVGWLQPRNMFV